jgi:hypothetical protein
MKIIRFILSLLAVSLSNLSNLLVASLPNLKKSEAGSQKTAGSIGSEIRTQRLSPSLIFLFLLLTSNFVLPICGQVWADQVDTLRPAEDIAGLTDWVKSPDVDSGYKNIDEAIPDEATTYLWQICKINNCNEGWKHSDFNTSNVIDSVRMTIRAKTTATDGTSQIRFNRMWCDVEGCYDCPYGGGYKEVNLTTSWINYNQTWSVEPCAGDPWTSTSLNWSDCCWWWRNNEVGSPPDSFGNTTADVNKKVTASGYIGLYRYQADFTDYIDKLAIYCKNVGTSSHYKVGIYSDSGTNHYPYQLLDTVAEFTIVPGWNRRDLVSGSVSIESGDWYWIAYRYETTGDTLKNEPATGQGRYKLWAYTSAWESPFTGGTGENAHYRFQAIRTQTGQNQVTQSFVVVYSHPTITGGKPGKNILSGGILK